MKKVVNDLGIASYLMLSGFQFVSRNGRSVIFNVDDKDLEEFDKLTMDYLQSPYHQFDHNIMVLKKIHESSVPLNGYPITDVGTCAFLLTNGYKIIGRRSKTYYINISNSEKEEVEKLIIDYANSPYSQFDSCLMALKKLGEVKN